MNGNTHTKRGLKASAIQVNWLLVRRQDLIERESQYKRLVILAKHDERKSIGLYVHGCGDPVFCIATWSLTRGPRFDLARFDKKTYKKLSTKQATSTEVYFTRFSIYCTERRN